MNEPDYEDRGMLKWAGFYLSDHTEKLHGEQQNAKKVRIPKPQMEHDEIQAVINQAILKQALVTIQKEERNLSGLPPVEIVGHIYGGDEIGLFISNQKIHYDEISNIEILPFEKWSYLE